MLLWVAALCNLRCTDPDRIAELKSRSGIKVSAVDTSIRDNRPIFNLKVDAQAWEA